MQVSEVTSQTIRSPLQSTDIPELILETSQRDEGELVVC
jgi:hypothetical protein